MWTDESVLEDRKVRVTDKNDSQNCGVRLYSEGWKENHLGTELWEQLNLWTIRKEKPAKRTGP